MNGNMMVVNPKWRIKKEQPDTVQELESVISDPREISSSETIQGRIKIENTMYTEALHQGSTDETKSLLKDSMMAIETSAAADGVSQVNPGSSNRIVTCPGSVSSHVFPTERFKNQEDCEFEFTDVQEENSSTFRLPRYGRIKVKPEDIIDTVTSNGEWTGRLAELKSQVDLSNPSSLSVSDGHWFVCLICKYKTHLSSAIVKHIRVHTGEKPYVCNECDYREDEEGADCDSRSLPDEVDDQDDDENEEENDEGNEEGNEERNEARNEERNEDDETEENICTDDNLVNRVATLQEELLTKAASLEETQNAFDAAVLEAGRISEKMTRLQEEIASLKMRNDQLQASLDERVFNAEAKLLLESRVAELEAELSSARTARNLLETRLAKLERERSEEISLVQQALEGAMNEQAEREAKYQKEFETERTLSSQREIQMLEDFEWKLRETERNARKKIEVAEAEAANRIQHMEMRLARAESDLERIGELKLCEIELKHLKVTSSEQRRNLRHVTRQYEELQVNEKILQEEVNRLRAAIEKEKQQWEEKMRRELAKLKVELEKTHLEERIVAVNLVQHTKNLEISELEEARKKMENDYAEQILRLNKKLASKDEYHKQALENSQTSFDREMMDLRRKMDKVDMEYQSKLEKMQEDHDNEISKLKTEYEEKIAQIEANYQIQVGSLRNSVELMKQQLADENQARIDQLKSLHRQQLEEQWEASAKERRSEVRAVEERHRAALEQLRKELDEIRKVGQPSTVSTPNSQSVIGSLFRYFTQAVNPTTKQNSHQKVQISEPSKLNIDVTNSFCCGSLDGIEEVATGSDAEKILYAKVQQLLCQSNEDKAEIARLRRCLEETDCVKQQKQSPIQPPRQQHPPHPSRRNRKRRN